MMGHGQWWHWATVAIWRSWSHCAQILGRLRCNIAWWSCALVGRGSGGKGQQWQFCCDEGPGAIANKLQ
eukprot:3755036-Alexandrium_andersonii.AAC.1